jgi:hypothetical protein
VFIRPDANYNLIVAATRAQKPAGATPMLDRKGRTPPEYVVSSACALCKTVVTYDLAI